MDNEWKNRWATAVGDLSGDGRTPNELWDSLHEQMQALVSVLSTQQSLTDDQKSAFRSLLADFKLLYVSSQEQSKLHNKRMTEIEAMQTDLLAARLESERLRARIRYDFLQLRTIRKIAGDALSGGRGVRDDGA